MAHREVSLEMLDAVMQNPEQVYEQPNGRTIFQSQMKSKGGNNHLLRIAVDMTENPPLVLTVIPTNKVAKYWRK